MKKYVMAVVKEPSLVTFVCDKCNKEISFDNIPELQETYSINFTGGYASVFGDGNIVECDLCQDCLKELIGDFCNYNNDY